MAKEILVAYGVDVDAVAGWLGSYGGENSPDDISRGLFAGEVGTPRLLDLFARHDLKTTWFIPGHSIETFPSETQLVVDGGHEIGIHGYSHENPIAMTREQETAILDKCIDLVEEVSGKRPTGYVAPWWEFSNVTNELLLERGIKYDHSLMHKDFHPYYVRVGDSWTKIDYAKQAEEWMVPLQRGEETDLIEIPASWYLDDLPPMMFIKGAPNSHGFVNPRHLEEIWIDQFDWVYREYDYAVFTMTIHPDVSGRPQVLLMHERIIEHINKHDGVRWATFDEIADDFAEEVASAEVEGEARPAALRAGSARPATSKSSAHRLVPRIERRAPCALPAPIVTGVDRDVRPLRPRPRLRRPACVRPAEAFPRSGHRAAAQTARCRPGRRQPGCRAPTMRG